LVTWQALRGQSIVRPDALTLTAGSVLGILGIMAATLVVLTGNRTHGRRSAPRADRRPTRGPSRKSLSARLNG
jgi:hypothetical protein